MKSTRPLGTSQPTHIQGVPVAEAPAANLGRSMSDILAERGLLDVDPAATPVAPTETFHREKSKVFTVKTRLDMLRSKVSIYQSRRA